MTREPKSPTNPKRKSPKTRKPWLPSLTALSLILSFATRVRADDARPEVVIEVTPGAGELVSEPITRRLIHLELADFKLPPDEERPSDSQTLFFRMVVEGEGALRIELWDRGDLSGVRRVSAGERAKNLLARHVALATAELAQGLARQRRIRAKRAERERSAEAVAEAEQRARQRLERWALSAGGKGAWLSETNAWLAGPSLGFQLNHQNSGRLELNVQWLAGDAGSVPGSRALQWFELELSPSFRFDRVSTSVGFDLAAAVVSLSGVEAVDAIPGQRQSWSARAGLRMRYQPRLTERLRLDLGPELAYLLRDVPVTSENGEHTRLGGLWVGVGLGFLLDS